MDDDIDQHTEEPDDRAAPDWETEARKARREAHSLRRRLRRTEIEARFGRDVAELIPDELPIHKWDEFAGMIAARLPQPVEEAARPDEDVAPTLEPTPEERRIAAAFAGGTSGYHGEADIGTLSAKEIMELGKENPALAARQIQQQYRNR